jgi:HlyD family secretion protein
MNIIDHDGKKQNMGGRHEQVKQEGLQAMKHWKRVITIFTVIAIVVASLAVSACGDDSEDKSEPEEKQSVEVKRGTLSTIISAFGNVSMPHQANLAFGLSGTVEELKVALGDTVNEGDILAKLETASLERAVAQAEADLRTAQLNLEQISSDTSILKAEAVVESAESSLASAEQALQQAQDFSVSDAETDLENAQRSLATAQRNAEVNIKDAEEAVDDAYEAYFDFLLANMENLAVHSVKAQKDELRWLYEKALENLEIIEEEATTSVANAQANVTTADNALANAPIVIQQKEAAVATAKAALAEAKDNLTHVESGSALELLQIKADKAQITLDGAIEQLEQATIVAPFDGMVAEVNAIVGDQVMGNAVVVHLVDIRQAEIDASVDETDSANVKVGQRAEISIDALPKLTLSGRVTAVSPTAETQSGLVTYNLAVSIQNAGDVNLKEGMTASVDINVALAENVLLVPSAAIQKEAATGEQIVTVLTDNGQEEPRVVETGATYRKLTEITAGLEEGELIVSSVDIEIPQGFQSVPSADTEMSQDIADVEMSPDITECMKQLAESQECFEKLRKMGESMGADTSTRSRDIDWGQIERLANDDSGMMPGDIQECMKELLKNRECIEKLTKMAEDMGIDPNDFSSDDWGGMGGM